MLGRKCFALLLVGCVFIMGCYTVPPQDPDSYESKAETRQENLPIAEEQWDIISAYYQVTDQGVFLNDLLEPWLFCYFDEKNCALIPYCFKPDCTHNNNDEDCTAAFLRKRAGMKFMYEDHLCYFAQETNEKDEPEYTFYQADEQGTNARKVFTISENPDGMKCLLKENHIILKLKTHIRDEKTREIYDLYGIADLNLSDGEITYIEENNKQNNMAFVCAGEGDKIYYSYLARPGQDEYREAALIEYDCRTGKKREIFFGDLEFGFVTVFNGRAFVTGQSQEEKYVVAVDVSTGEEVDRFPVTTESGRAVLNLYGNHVIVCIIDDGWYEYNYSKDEWEKIRDYDDDFSLKLCTKNNVLMVMRGSDIGYIDYASFLAGGTPVMLTENGVILE